jgi:hypothetical protein
VLNETEGETIHDSLQFNFHINNRVISAIGKYSDKQDNKIRKHSVYKTALEGTVVQISPAAVFNCILGSNTHTHT